MRLTLRPLNFVDINHFVQVERVDIIQGNPGTFYAQLWDDDAGIGGSSTPAGPFGLSGISVQPGQRYISSATQTFKILMQRTMTVAPVPASQDFSVPMVTVDARDKSIVTWNWTAAQVAICISGGVILQMTDSSSGITYNFPVDHFLRNRSSDVGA